MNPPYQEEASSCFTHDGVLYNLNTVLWLSAKLPIETIEVSELVWTVGIVSPEELKRAERTDLTCPILVAKFGDRLVTVDGYHRLIKAIHTAESSLPCRHVTEEILLAARIP